MTTATRITAIIALALISGTSLTCEAQVLNLSSTSIAPTIEHYFSGGGYMTSYDSQFFTLPTPAISLKNYNSIQIAVNAPTGYAWWVHTTGLTGAYLSLGAAYGSPITGPLASITSASVSFNFIQGGPAHLLLPSESGWIPLAGDRFQLDSSYLLNADVALTGFTWTVGYDNSALATAALSAFNIAFLEFDYSTSSDPGQRLTLAVIPEPACVSLAVLGLAVFGSVRLRERAGPTRRSASQQPDT